MMTKIRKNNLALFCDMDGVLVDFMGGPNGVIPTINKTIARVAASSNTYKQRQPGLYKAVKKAIAEMGGDIDTGDTGPAILYEDVGKQTAKKKVRSLMYTLISNNRTWWANLNWHSGGKEIWEYIEDYRPIVCTGPMGPNSKKGKRDWCKRELGLGKDRIIITHTKHEEIRRVREAGKIALLIDDMPKYVVPWRNAGGIAIHHDFQNPLDTIEQLKAMGL